MKSKKLTDSEFQGRLHYNERHNDCLSTSLSRRVCLFFVAVSCSLCLFLCVCLSVCMRGKCVRGCMVCVYPSVCLSADCLSLSVYLCNPLKANLFPRSVPRPTQTYSRRAHSTYIYQNLHFPPTHVSHLYKHTSFSHFNSYSDSCCLIVG